MKKQTTELRKLSLNRETVAPLQPEALEQVNGGVIWTVVPVAVAVTLLWCAAGQAR